MEGRYVPSLLAAIGHVIEHHLIEIGFMTRREDIAARARAWTEDKAHRAGGAAAMPAALAQCPKCGEAAIIRQEDCDLCISCGHSKCA
jgi:ribonucleoside-diphosphate reductase alpha chain